MSPPGRPKGESLSAQREGSPMSPPGRPEGESLSAPREGRPGSTPGAGGAANARLLHADGRFRDDGWQIVRDDGASAHGAVRVVPLHAFLAADAADEPAVWLAPTDDPAALEPRLQALSLIAVDFPKVADGRGYSTAALLRRAGYRGELRAIGEILIDQLYMLRRVGFSSFALRADQDPALAVAALHRYSDAYQAAGDGLVPPFRRPSAGAQAPR